MCGGSPRVRPRVTRAVRSRIRLSGWAEGPGHRHSALQTNSGERGHSQQLERWWESSVVRVFACCHSDGRPTSGLPHSFSTLRVLIQDLPPYPELTGSAMLTSLLCPFPPPQVLGF